MRKLASIQKILSITPIEGADKIEAIKVLGWNLVAKKGQFKENDLCVYFEIDSILPDTQHFEFLKPNFRLRSKRLKSIISQGLAMPLDILPTGNYTVGDDVTNIIGVTKWEPPAAEAKEIEGLFPTDLVPKTDEIRIQSLPKILDDLKGVECYSTVKLDGQSLTFIKKYEGNDIKNYVCTRNFKVKDIPGSIHWQVAKDLNIFENIPCGYAVQGELVGEGIQKNRLGIKGKQFFAFQVFNIETNRYLDLNEFLYFCDALKVPHVPIESRFVLNHSVDDLLEMAKGKYSSGHPREGIVIRPVKELFNYTILQHNSGQLGRTSFKVINNDYLLKVNE